MIEIDGDAAAPQIGFGDGAWNGTREREETRRGLRVTRCSRRRVGHSKFEGSSRRLIQKGSGFVKRLAYSGKPPIEADKIKEIAMLASCSVHIMCS